MILIIMLDEGERGPSVMKHTENKSDPNGKYKLEQYGRGWAATFPEDIVMWVEEDA